MSKKKAKRKTRPKLLRLATRKWIESVKATYELDAHHVMLLELAGRAWDRAMAAAEDIAKNGTTFEDRFGAIKARPSCKIENESMAMFLRTLRELALDIEPPSDPKRPPAIKRSF